MGKAGRRDVLVGGRCQCQVCLRSNERVSF